MPNIHLRNSLIWIFWTKSQLSVTWKHRILTKYQLLVQLWLRKRHNTLLCERYLYLVCKRTCEYIYIDIYSTLLLEYYACPIVAVIMMTWNSSAFGLTAAKGHGFVSSLAPLRYSLFKAPLKDTAQWSETQAGCHKLKGEVMAPLKEGKVQMEGVWMRE